MDYWQIISGIVTGVFFAGAMYAGIRADLKGAIACAIEAKAEAGEAHKRIDTLLLRGRS